MTLAEEKSSELQRQKPLPEGVKEIYPRALVRFDDYKELVTKVEAHRAKRLVDFDTFQTMSKEQGVIILDTRSAFRYERIHFKGAKHLSFSDFTQDSLAKLIPDPNTKILIYCNNNFKGNQVDFASKTVVPTSGASTIIAGALGAEAKPRMMALNVPTYISLYGYGYRNVYELHELVDVDDPRARFEGSAVLTPATAISPSAPTKSPKGEQMVVGWSPSRGGFVRLLSDLI